MAATADKRADKRARDHTNARVDGRRGIQPTTIWAQTAAGRSHDHASAGNKGTHLSMPMPNNDVGITGSNNYVDGRIMMMVEL